MRPDMDQYLRGVVLSVNLPNVDCIDRAILTAIITHFLVMVCSILRNHPLFTPIQSDFYSFKAQTDWNLFLSIQLIYFLFLMIYVTFKELSNKIGDTKIKKLFLG